VALDGEPRELDKLVALVEAMAGSELFARARAAPVCLPEVPFSWRGEVDGRVQIVEGRDRLPVPARAAGGRWSTGSRGGR
jgi:hypothetical protein